MNKRLKYFIYTIFMIAMIFTTTKVFSINSYAYNNSGIDNLNVKDTIILGKDYGDVINKFSNYDTTLSENLYYGRTAGRSYYQYLLYKINVTQSGYLKFEYEEEVYTDSLYLKNGKYGSYLDSMNYYGFDNGYFSVYILDPNKLGITNGHVVRGDYYLLIIPNRRNTDNTPRIFAEDDEISFKLVLGHSLNDTTISLNKTEMKMYAGETESLVETITPSHDEYAIYWRSSNEKVVTVNNGVVKALSPGRAVVTVGLSYFGIHSSCTVDVRFTNKDKQFVNKLEKSKVTVTKYSPLRRSVSLKIKNESKFSKCKYQIRYRVKGHTDWFYEEVKSLNPKIKELNPDNTYEIQVRASRKIGGTYFSKWTKTKIIKTKPYQ